MSEPNEKPRAGKTVDVTVEVEATPEAVWRVISQAEEISRWFSPTARVEPGVGGSIFLSWGEGVEGTAPITVWEEGRKLRTAEQAPGANGPIELFVEYQIEALEGGRTKLRLVQSGFEPGEQWDDYVDTLDTGWQYFLWNLKHYLEHHDGKPRRMVSDRRKFEQPRAEVWQELLGGGLVACDQPATVGAPVKLWSGEPGEIHMVNEGIHLSARIPGLEEGLLLVELEPGGEPFSVGVWLSLYGVEEETAARLESELREHLDALAPRPS